MESFATVNDLQAGWRTLTEAESEVAATLLERATAQIVAMLERSGIKIDASNETQQTNLKTVNCNMVRRVMGQVGNVSQMTQSIGSTSASVSFSNPDGSLYLSKGDRVLLGLAGKSRYRSIQAHTWADEWGRGECSI